MFSKEEFLKLVVYFTAAITASIIRFIRADKKSFPIFMLEILLGASFAFFIVPALVEYFHLSLYMGTGLTWLLTMFSETVLNKFKTKLSKKIDDVTDNID